MLNTEESHINVDIILSYTVSLKFTYLHKEIYLEMLSMKICKNMSQITKQSSSSMLVHRNQTQPIKATEFTNPKYKQIGTKYNANENVKKDNFQALLVTRTSAL